jgi:hypothetical protein
MISGCANLSSDLKPVVSQNQENVGKLVTNVGTLMGLYEPLLDAGTNSMIYQHIGKVIQEMTAVVGSPALSPPTPDQSWQMRFDDAAKKYAIARQERYAERYQFVKSAVARRIAPEDLEKLQSQEGWIYSAATNPDFSPTKAHEILRKLANLKLSYTDNDQRYYQEAEMVLSTYDPALQALKETISSAKILLGGLKIDINTQLTTAATDAQTIATATNDSSTTAKLGEKITTAITDIKPEEIKAVLDQLSQQYLNKPTFREGAIDLLIKGAIGFF